MRTQSIGLHIIYPVYLMILYNIIYTGITTTPFLHFEDVEGDYCFINTDEILAIEFVKSRNKKIFKPKK